MPLIAFFQIFPERAWPPPGGTAACPPTDAWQSFMVDTGYTLKSALAEPLAVAALIAVAGMLILAASRPFAAPAQRVSLYAMTLIGISVGTATVALMPRLNVYTPLLLSIAAFLLSGAALAITRRSPPDNFR